MAGVRWGAFTCVMWQVTLWHPVALRWGSHEKLYQPLPIPLYRQWRWGLRSSSPNILVLHAPSIIHMLNSKTCLFHTFWCPRMCLIAPQKQNKTVGRGASPRPHTRSLRHSPELLVGWRAPDPTTAPPHHHHPWCLHRLDRTFGTQSRQAPSIFTASWRLWLNGDI